MKSGIMRAMSRGLSAQCTAGMSAGAVFPAWEKSMPYADEAKRRAWAKARRRRRRRELTAIYGKRCECCGARDVPLEWHHVEGGRKHYEFGRNIAEMSDKAMMEEVSHCSRVCRDCHFEIHGRDWRG